ncbi:hypothetical protein F5148DRAFT_1145963 [Russula earlei]|uniref:Uncharacterized protein n=1 Tax=Russula earlei TaxID=71964 RepID=A0ACC0UNI4_9AGAM|nr:hypothetical protein F5148DRAFT_1145963 [Russula earlei]
MGTIGIQLGVPSLMSIGEKLIMFLYECDYYITHGNPVKHHPPRNPQKAMKQCTNVADVVASKSSDGTDDDYEEPESTSSPGSDMGDTLIPSNAEVAGILPSNTVPTIG